jgi:hypothetical protein
MPGRVMAGTPKRGFERIGCEGGETLLDQVGFGTCQRL